MVSAILLAVCGSGQAQTARSCGAPPEPAVIEVVTADPQVSVNDRFSKADLAGLAAREYGHVHAEGVSVFGLTVGRVKSELYVESLLIEAGDGQKCGWPSRLVARVAYEGPIEVYVAREYRRGSCQHDAVLQHEMEHVTVFRAAVRDYEALIRAALQQVREEALFPVTGQDAELVRRRIGQRFEGAFRGAVAAATAARNRINALLDTPDSYQRTRLRCDFW